MVERLFVLQAELDAIRYRTLIERAQRKGSEFQEYRFCYAATADPAPNINKNLTEVTGITHTKHPATGAIWVEQQAEYLEPKVEDSAPMVIINPEEFTGWKLPGLTDSATEATIDALYARGTWQRRQTIIAALKRTALWQETELVIHSEDMRFAQVEPDAGAKIVVLALLDQSSSMVRLQIEIGRTFFYLLRRFLHTCYPQASIVFISHNSGAVVVDEEAFFSGSSSGGTCCSSAYELALDVIKHTYAGSEWKRYIYHISDGDNLPGDNPHCLRLMQELLVYCESAVYIETTNGLADQANSLYRTLAQLTDDRMTLLRMYCLADVPHVMQKLFRSSVV